MNELENLLYPLLRTMENSVPFYCVLAGVLVFVGMSSKGSPQNVDSVRTSAKI